MTFQSSKDVTLRMPTEIRLQFDPASYRWELSIDNGDGLERLGFVSGTACGGMNQIEDALNNTSATLYFFRSRMRSVMPGEVIDEKDRFLHDWAINDALTYGQLFL